MPYQTMDITAENRHSPRCRTLPLEVWERILCSITDTRYLPRVWLNCRRVSTVLKAATEHAFARTHLRHTDISFMPSEMVHDKDDNKYTLDVMLKFNRLSDDGTRAIYVPDHPGPDYDWMKGVEMDRGAGEETLHAQFMALWRSIITPYISSSPEERARCHMEPSHVLAVRNLANDTELVGIEADPARMELSVLWKPTLSLFFGEDEYQKWADKVRFQHKKQDDPVKASMAQMAEQVRSGQVDMMEYMRRAVEIVGKSHDDLHAAVRRLRFRQTLRKLRASGAITDHDEAYLPVRTAVPQAIKDTHSAMNFAEFDDNYPYSGMETRRGCFYDGMHMTFEGKAEKNEVVEDLGIKVHWQGNEDDEESGSENGFESGEGFEDEDDWLEEDEDEPDEEGEDE